jgi:glycosyltransferase involved in cell wall biosynthesis
LKNDPSLKPGQGWGTLGPVKISIVVPAYNEERLLAGSLTKMRAAAAAFTARGWDFELIVCDNNSTDRTAEIARAAGASVVFEPVNQIGRARNRGAAAATGDWLIFVDADSHPGPELFADVAEQIQSGRCLAGGSTVRLDSHHWLSELVNAFWNFLSRRGRLLAGSFIFCETAAFRKIGGFSDKLFAGEELELTGRLKKLARETGRSIVILHRHPLVTSARKLRLYSLREYLRLVLRAGLNRRTLADRDACYMWYDGRR